MRRRLRDRIARRLGYMPVDVLAVRWQRIVTPPRRLAEQPQEGDMVTMTAWIQVPSHPDAAWWVDGLEFESTRPPTPYVTFSGAAR